MANLFDYLKPDKKDEKKEDKEETTGSPLADDLLRKQRKLRDFIKPATPPKK